MKKTLCLLMLLAACTSPAAMPVERPITHVSTPFQWGHDEYHYLFRKEYGVHGLRLNTFYVNNRYMLGLDLGVWNASVESASGIQLAIYRNETRIFKGIQLALWNAETGQTGGIQIAGVSTDAEDLYGLQLTGLLGRARAINGFQIAGLSAISESEEDEVWTKGLQMALYETRAENLGGIQIAGVFSDTSWTANGIQLTLLFGEARYFNGIQIGGLTARAKESAGIQLAGLLARSEISSGPLLQFGGILAQAGDLDGALQLSLGVCNAEGQARAWQISGLGNMAGSLHGLGAAIGWNYAFEDVNGVQIAAIHNRARFVNGVQIGLFNHCERLSGVQIGLINSEYESPVRYFPFIRANF
jgi:hypothetical protein